MKNRVDIKEKSIMKEQRMRRPSIAQRKWFFKGLPLGKKSHPLNCVYRKVARVKSTERVHTMKKIEELKKPNRQVRRRLYATDCRKILAADVRAATLTCAKRIFTNVAGCNHEWDCKRYRIVTKAPVKVYNLTDVHAVFNRDFISQLDQHFGHVRATCDDDFVSDRSHLQVSIDAVYELCINPVNYAGLLSLERTDDPYTAFMSGDIGVISTANVSKKLLKTVQTIKRRRLDLIAQKGLGNELVTLDAIEPFGAICVYGGNLIRPDQCKISKTHTKTLGRNVGQIDAPFPLGLPMTHWGAFANSSIRPTATFEYIRWEQRNHVRDLVVLFAGYKGICANSEVTTNYRVEYL